MPKIDDMLNIWGSSLICYHVKENKQPWQQTQTHLYSLPLFTVWIRLNNLYQVCLPLTLTPIPVAPLSLFDSFTASTHWFTDNRPPGKAPSVKICVFTKKYKSVYSDSFEVRCSSERTGKCVWGVSEKSAQSAMFIHHILSSADQKAPPGPLDQLV